MVSVSVGREGGTALWQMRNKQTPLAQKDHVEGRVVAYDYSNCLEHTETNTSDTMSNQLLPKQSSALGVSLSSRRIAVKEGSLVLDANPWKHTTTPPLGRRHPASSLSLRMDMNHGPSAIMPRREQDAAFPAVVLHVLQTAHHKGNAAETEDAADGCRPTPRTTQP